MDENNILKEYEDLRNEIKQKIELHNSQIIFMITTVIAILAFALESKNELLYLLPFGIIIPISMRITYYRTVMAKLSAYIIVFIEDKIEGLNWETRNRELIKSDKSSLFDKCTISHYFEGLMLSIGCCSLYIWSLIEGKIINAQKIIFLAVLLILVAWEAVITKRIITFNNEKSDWVEKWKGYREHENNG